MKTAIILIPDAKDGLSELIQAWHERWEIIEVLEAYPDENGFDLEVFDFLLPYCHAKNFDVLLLPSFESLGFSELMLGQLIERVIQANAEIHTLEEEITEQNYTQWLPSDYLTLETLKGHRERWHKVHFEVRFHRGIPYYRFVPESHRVVMDEDGQVIGLELNPETQQKWQDLATLIMEQHYWKEIGHRMYKHYGHTNAEGKPHLGKYYEAMVYKPSFWGHSCTGHRNHHIGAWAYQEGETIPEGVVIHYNTHTPVWSGELGEKIKEELSRRAELDLDINLPSETLDGLLICGKCGKPLQMYVNGMWLVWRCKTHSRETSLVLRDRTALKYVKNRVRELVNTLNVNTLLPSSADKLNKLLRAIESTQQSIKEITPVPESLYRHLGGIRSNILEEAYMEMVILADLRLERLEELQDDLQRQLTLNRLRQALDTGSLISEKLLDESYERFWHLPPKSINQLLSRLMDEQKFVILDGEIVGISR
jgi:hypothetical protein